ncbi:MAG: DNA methyltransferase, partial [Chloroflexota bacterium]
MVELIWDGKYDADGNRVAPLRIALPFQTVETVNESAQQRQLMLDLFSAGRNSEWRNRLIWGDKKYVLPSLLPEFAGKVDLIYIDPPFATGADFSFQTQIGDEEFTKEPSMIEEKAYRDMWGRGIDSYLQWFYETAAVLHELLDETGSLVVHIGSNLNHYIRQILDEVFGEANYINQIIWKRSDAHSDIGQGAKHLGRIHDVLMLYSKSQN